MVRATSLIGAKGFRELQDKKGLKEGILVFTDAMTLAHKQDDGLKEDDNYCYWGTMKMPKKFTEVLELENAERVSVEDSFRYELIKEFPIYFAIKGVIQGYFIIHKISAGDYEGRSDKISNFHLEFYSESWHEIKHGETLKPSQGWRYYPKNV